MRRTIARTLSLLILSVMMTGPASAVEDKAKPLTVLRISPSGQDIAATRQIVIEYSKPVAALGRMERTAEETGISISPPVNCQWRWLNATALACQIAEKDTLLPATRYSVTITPKITDQDGGALAETIEHSFTTTLPRLSGSSVVTWKAPSVPVFRASFNQAVTKESVALHVYFEDEKTKTRTPAHVEQDPLDEEKPDIRNGLEGRPLWIVTPVKELPLNSKISLKQEAGLVSTEGSVAGTDATTVRDFYTFPEFALRGISCFDKDNKEVLLTSGIPQTDDQLCNPMRPVAISFSSPVLRSSLIKNLSITPPLGGGNKNSSPWGSESRDWSRLSDYRSSQEADFQIGLPVGLNAAQDYVFSVNGSKPSFWQRIIAFFKDDQLEHVSGLKDEFGRALPPFTIRFATGHRNPNYELVYRDAVLEKNIDSELPVYVNNLESIAIDYSKTDANGSRKASTGDVSVPFVQDKQFAIPANVRDILEGRSGALYGRLSTKPSVDGKWDGASRMFVQVTPFQVYAKLGHFQSLAWVSDLQTGKGVANARVTVYPGSLSEPRTPENILATVMTDEDGLAMLPGLDTLDPDLSKQGAWKDEDTRLFVRIDKDDDMALLPIAYDYEVQLWNVASGIYSNSEQKFGHMKAWGMTAQGIYRAGDTMQYKIYLRDQDNNRFIAPPEGQYNLEITDPTGKSVEKRENIALSEFGTVAGEYKIPDNAPIGWYSFKLDAVLMDGGTKFEKSFYPLSTLVSDFTPAPFRVSTELNGDSFKTGDTLDIVTEAKLHSGGAYGGAAARINISLQSRPFFSKDPAAEDYSFSSFDGETDRETILEKQETLDDRGEVKTSFKIPQKNIAYGKILVESGVRDDRGKTIASEARADYAGVDRFVGLKQTEWVYESGKPANILSIVTNEAGKPISGIKTRLVIEREEISTASVKGAGNAYLNDNTVEWKKVAGCDLRSGAKGEGCAFTPETAGTYRVTASVRDTKGHEHKSTQQFWVGGGSYVQWNEGREYALPLTPEHAEYKVGDTARYLVQNPWPGAKALVTVERYGVMHSFITTLENSAPVIEIPVKEEYLPGFYVSVVAFSPRVDMPPPGIGQIDMGKPAVRVGYARTPVIDTYKEIIVTAKAEQDVYRPRDNISVSLNAKARHNNNSEPIELAVAVLDEAVFDLISDGRNAFDPYHGFYNMDTLDVTNYSLMSRLVGRQKFERKGANPGGDGGVDLSMRDIFKFVSYWNPSVPVDANGNAHIEFSAPDNLTGWRVLAIATTRNDLMGLGDAEFKVNRPTEIRPVMPNQVRETDDFNAGFSVMNRTDQTRTLTVKIKADGSLSPSKDAQSEKTVTLAPYARETIYIPLKAARLPSLAGTKDGNIHFSISAGDDFDADSMEHSLPVLKSRIVQVSAIAGSTVEDSVTQPVEVPNNILQGSAVIGLTLSPTVISGLDGAFTYMRDYPYPCWEQRLSMAVMASNYGTLKPYLQENTAWPESDTLTADILATAPSYQAPGGGMAYFSPKDEYADPYLSAYTALAFGWLKQSGHKIIPSVEEGLQKYLLSFLRNNTAPDYYNPEMMATTRAVILAAYADDGKINADDIARFRKDLNAMSLFGKAHYMMAAQKFPEAASSLKAVKDAIMSSAIESAATLSFNDTIGSGYERILGTTTRDNCAALVALSLEGLDPDKAFRTANAIILARKGKEAFQNTQENVFCTSALVSYARAYESDAPDMHVSSSYGQENIAETDFKAFTDAPFVTEKVLPQDTGGKSGSLTITRQGTGRLYYNTRLSYEDAEARGDTNAGLSIERVYSIRKNGQWTKAALPLTLARGDVVRVDLYVSTPTGRSFVVVNDPLPGALETVNTDLATASKNDAGDSDGSSIEGEWTGYGEGRWSFYHRELRHDSARFYADWLDPGNYKLTYTVQAVADGTFLAPPVRVEEMYNPDIYGLGTGTKIVVETAH